jgi:hypothetical protein
MTEKARTRKLYSKVEGDVLMERAPEDEMMKESNKNDKKWTRLKRIVK